MGSHSLFVSPSLVDSGVHYMVSVAEQQTLKHKSAMNSPKTSKTAVQLQHMAITRDSIWGNNYPNLNINL